MIGTAAVDPPPGKLAVEEPAAAEPVLAAEPSTEEFVLKHPAAENFVAVLPEGKGSRSGREETANDDQGTLKKKKRKPRAKKKTVSKSVNVSGTDIVMTSWAGRKSSRNLSKHTKRLPSGLRAYCFYG